MTFSLNYTSLNRQRDIISEEINEAEKLIDILQNNINQFNANGMTELAKKYQKILAAVNKVSDSIRKRDEFLLDTQAKFKRLDSNSADSIDDERKILNKLIL